MRIRTWGSVVILTLGILLPAAAADAQSASRVPRIGVLRLGSPPDPFVEAFREGLRDLGYVEGKNIVVEYGWGEGRADRIAELAAELVRRKVDVIVAGGTGVTRAARQATAEIPIVMPAVADPVASGFVASLSRPGGNVTGLAVLASELSSKRLQLLTEVAPKAARVAVLWDPTSDATQLQTAEVAARSLGVQLQFLEVRGPHDFEGVFGAAQKERAGAFIVLSSPIIFAHRAHLTELTAKSRLPAMFPYRELVDAGGLMSYGPSLPDMYRRAAIYVDKILKGAKPADLPVEQPTRFELVINLKTAKALGLTIPPSVLIRADQVIQ